MDQADVLIGAAIAVGSIVLTVLTQFVAALIEGAQRRGERRKESRRETLLALQDALDDLAGNGAIALSLLMRPGARKGLTYDDPNGQAAIRASIRMTSLSERVPEGGIRESIKKVDESWRMAVAAQSEEATMKAIEEMRTNRRAANAGIGEAFRSL